MPVQLQVPQQDKQKDKDQVVPNKSILYSNRVRLCGSAWSECGYCKGGRSAVVGRERTASSNAYSIVCDLTESSLDKDSSNNQSVVAGLDPAIYDALLQRGWRRSGLAIYLPNNSISCCPAYTIRLPVNEFTASSSQRKMMARATNILRDGGNNGASRCHIRNEKDQLSTLGDCQRSFHHHLESVIKESGIIDYLKAITEQSLPEMLAVAGTTSHHTIRSEDVIYKIKHARNGKNNSNALTLTVSQNEHLVEIYTPVCAAIAGRSLGKLDGGRLSEELCKSMKQRLQVSLVDVEMSRLNKMRQSEQQTHQEQSAVNDVVTKKHRVSQRQPWRDFIKIVGVTAHSESGQVFVHLIVSTDFVSTTKWNIEQPCKKTTTFEHNAKVNNKITHWIDTVYKSRAQADSPHLLNLQPPYTFYIKTIPAYQSALMPDVHQLYWSYQHSVHNDPDPFQDDAMTQTSQIAASFSSCPFSNNNGGDETSWLWAEHAPKVWLKDARTMLQHSYQHLSKAKQNRLVKLFGEFYLFLVENPFAVSSAGVVANSSDGKSFLSYGCYHQHYRLFAGGPLVAVGVIDILPSGLSSVYLFYDKSFSQTLIPMGKYAIMREIEWTQQANLPYYYLGYYIESCSKMRYKAEYCPSQLLCPKHYKWVDANKAKAVIQQESLTRHFCSLYKGKVEDKNQDFDIIDSEIIKHIPLDVGIGQPIMFDMLQDQGQEVIQPYLKAFVDAVSPQIAAQITVIFC